MTDSTALVNGREVEITGPQAHPYRCTECSACYRNHRAAAKCCIAASEDLRTSAVRAYCPAFEAEAMMEYDRKMEDLYKEYHFECSCGESFRTVDSAISCRKCREYTPAGFCTQVTDRDQDDQVVWAFSVDVAKTGLGVEVGAPTNDCAPLTHNPFAVLGS
ncbi:MAG: hypothetical protein HOE14_10550 [Gemmatimonadales bacterium]|jgi:hypothetical protein|nr:hypothetical protein [Gemmatimonadales bacterium]